MSNFYSPKQEQQKFIMRFDMDIKKEKFLEKEKIEHYLEYDFQRNVYDYILKVFSLVEFNVKGLFENIIYVKMLIKKGLFNISIDIYLEQIVKHLLYNYKYQIVNEFALINQHISLKANTIYNDEYDYLEGGVEYAMKLYEAFEVMTLWVNTYEYNLQQSVRFSGANYDHIIDNLEENEKDIFYNHIKDKRPMLIRRNGQDTYYIEKVCNKIIKFIHCDYGSKKQVKKADLDYLKLILGKEKPYPNLYQNVEYVRNNLMRINIFEFKNSEIEKEFVLWCKNKKREVLNLEEMFKYIHEDYYEANKKYSLY